MALLEMRIPLEVRGTDPFQAEECESASAEPAEGPYRSAGDLEALCPACSRRLDRASQFGVELDVCPRHGTWFDRGELRTLARRLAFEAATQRGHEEARVQVGIAEANKTIEEELRKERSRRRAVLGPVGAWLYEQLSDE